MRAAYPLLYNTAMRKWLSAVVRKTNWKMWGTLTLLLLLPLLYQTLETALFKRMPNTSSYEMANSMPWVYWIFSSLEAAVLLPSFYLFGSVRDNPQEIGKRLRAGIVMVFAVYASLAILVAAFAPQIVAWQSKRGEDAVFNDLVYYVRLEAVGLVFSALLNFCLVMLIATNQAKPFFLHLAISLSTRALFDVFIASPLPCSLNVGSSGIAAASIVSPALSLLAIALWVRKYGIELFSFHGIDAGWFAHVWTGVFWALLEAILRNMVYLALIRRVLLSSSAYASLSASWEFLLAWILLPIRSLYYTELGDFGASRTAAFKRFAVYFFWASVLLLFGACLMPIYPMFIRVVLKKETLYWVPLTLFPFACFYAYSRIFEGIFYGRYLFMPAFFRSLLAAAVFLLSAYPALLSGAYDPVSAPAWASFLFAAWYPFVEFGCTLGFFVYHISLAGAIDWGLHEPVERRFHPKKKKREAAEN